MLTVTINWPELEEQLRDEARRAHLPLRRYIELALASSAFRLLVQRITEPEELLELFRGPGQTPQRATELLSPTGEKSE